MRPYTLVKVAMCFLSDATFVACAVLRIQIKMYTTPSYMKDWHNITIFILTSWPCTIVNLINIKKKKEASET